MGSKSRSKARQGAAKDWIEGAVKRPGRVREYLGVGKGSVIPMSKLNAAIAKLRVRKDKTEKERSMLSALLLAKRFKTKQGV